MAKGEKYYVVWKGHSRGVFETWEECQKQILNFNGALFKSFESKSEAEKALHSAPHLYLQAKVEKSSASKKLILESICVDGAYSGDTGKAEYQGVYVKTKQVLFKQGPFEEGGINLVEFLAIVHALAYCQKHQWNLPIYSDSLTAISWVKNKKIKSVIERNAKNEELFRLVDRALIWLSENKYSNPILKWDTDSWGENPADFGRK